MKISQEVRDFARDNGLDGDRDAVRKGMEEQAERFREKGGALYQEV